MLPNKYCVELELEISKRKNCGLNPYSYEVKMCSPEMNYITSESKQNSETKLFHEKVGELYKSSYKKLVDGMAITNPIIRFYCNKTLLLNQPMQFIIDDLVELQYQAMAYFDSERTDNFVLSAILSLIAKTCNLISWKDLTQSCYWEDLQRELKAIKNLAFMGQNATNDCVHSTMDKAYRAMEILQGVIDIPRKIVNLRLANTKVHSAGKNAVRISCQPGADAIFVGWENPNNGTWSEIILQEMCDSFKMKFLRGLLHQCRKCFELLIYSMLHIDAILKYEFPLEELQACTGVYENQLLDHEKRALKKTKGSFDSLWQDILETILTIRHQVNQLLVPTGIMRRLTKKPKDVTGDIVAIQLSVLQIDDPLFISIVTTAMSQVMIRESYNFTMYTDRHEDIILKIQDLWNLEKTNVQEMDILVILVYCAMKEELNLESSPDAKILRKRGESIVIEKRRARKFLQKTLKVFHHSAFREIRETTHGFLACHTEEFSRKKGSRTEISLQSQDSMGESMGISDTESPILRWIPVAGGYQVAIGNNNTFLVKPAIGELVEFQDLILDQKVSLIKRLQLRLLHCVAAEACQIKILYERTKETKSLLKRLKPKDRLNATVLSSVFTGVQHIKNLAKLIESTSVLKTKF